MTELVDVVADVTTDGWAELHKGKTTCLNSWHTGIYFCPRLVYLHTFLKGERCILMTC